MVLLIIIPMKNGYFIGNIPYFQTNPHRKANISHRIVFPFPFLRRLQQGATFSAIPATWFGGISLISDSAFLWDCAVRVCWDWTCHADSGHVQDIPRTNSWPFPNKPLFDAVFFDILVDTTCNTRWKKHAEHHQTDRGMNKNNQNANSCNFYASFLACTL